ncbi:MAG: 8-amino-7-oxononanoate synthase [Candidatus Omnitrophota bacterium]
MEELKALLKKREEESSLRSLKPISSRICGRIVIKEKEYWDFSSNDYLALSEHPLLKGAGIRALEHFGSSSTASRLMTGDLALHHELEERIASFKKKEAALVFNSGYQANTGIISALYAKGDAIFADRFSHASIIDGILLSGAKLFRFRHNDAAHCESLLQAHRKEFKKCLIVTETVFSMDGDEAPLRELVRLKEKYECSLMVDEAHATGIFGLRGSGIVEREGLEDDVEFVMGTFSKALGGFGAYLAASKDVISYLINTCRSFIYSTALPPAVIAINLAALDVIQKEPGRRQELLSLVSDFRLALKKNKVKAKGVSQIVSVVTGDNFKTVQAAEALQKKGYWVLPIRPPTVPTGEARLRFSLTLHHKKDILEKLADDILSIGI